MDEEVKAQQGLVGKLGEQLAAIEKRDWELWLIVVGTGMLVGAGLLTLLYPAAILKQGNVQMDVQIEASRELFLGLLVLLILLNTYVVTRRLSLRRTRTALISTAVQGELVRLQSFTDPLTELYNRRSLDHMWDQYVSRAKRLQKPLALMVIDVDGFKAINTRFGHLTGDLVLGEVAALLKTAVRGSDAVVRYGGDEFLVIMADSHARGAQAAVTRIGRLVKEWNSAGHVKDLELSLSVGVAEWAVDKTLEQALSEADEKMYAVKEARKAAVAAK